MSNKLIIHPKDRSTEFLTHVYAGLDDATVVRGGVRKDTLRHMVEDFDQIIMLGHGSSFGLMSVGQFKGTTYGDIVDHTFDEALAKKDNSIFIWCNADQFIARSKLNLRGFYTGMFISEMIEALYHKVDATTEQIEESNETFAKIVGAVSNVHPVEMHRLVTKYYGKLADGYDKPANPVAAYNNARLYISADKEQVAA